MPTVLADHPLRALNTFGMDARARWFCEVSSEDELRDVLARRELRADGLLVMGGGSNLLLSRDVPGLVLRPALRGVEQLEDDGRWVWLRAGAGEDWPAFVERCVLQGLSGLESLALIPGTVGAAPVQNIGAYGGEIRECLESVEGVEIASGQTVAFDNAACALGYRDSVFKRAWRNRVVITRVTLRLERGRRPKVRYQALADELARAGVTACTIRDVFDAVVRIRRAKLPDPALLGNAGSFFKNPTVSREAFTALRERFPALPAYPTAQPDAMKLAAGWLIEQAGWMGVRRGACGVHELQALVLVNHGGATGAEILALADEMRQSVLARFGVALEPEVVIV